jgi:hypothetical protein
LRKDLAVVALAAVVIMTLSTAAFFYPSISSDAWWQFSSGRQITTEKAIPQTDSFSCGEPREWIEHEWLFEVIIFKIFEQNGEAGVKAFSAAIFGGALFLIAMTAYFFSGRKILATLLAFSTSAFFLLHFAEERAQLVSFMFFAFFIMISSVNPSGKKIYLYYLLPVASVVWVNFHAVLPAALFVLAVNSGYHIYTAGERQKRLAIHLAVVFFLCVALSVFNPLGIGALLFFQSGMGIKSLVKEWHGILSMDSATTQYVLTVIIFLISGIAVIKSLLEAPRDRETLSRTVRLALLFLPFFAAVFLTRKILPLYAVIFACVYASSQRQEEVLPQARKWLMAIAAVALLAFGMKAAAGRGIIFYPQEAVRFLNSTPAGGCVFTAYEWGGYLEYFCAPGKKVYLNGRLNVDEKTARRYAYIYYAEKDFEGLILRLGVDYFLLPVYSPLAAKLARAGNTPIYSDDISVLYGAKLKLKTDKKLDTK